MDWLQGMNKVSDYIEENLSNEIRYESLARIVGCSAYEFARIFSFMTGCSVAEYIRKRRLSQAVYDIQGGKDKIIDIALKYGYESPTTFSRAFKELHGVTPSQAREWNFPFKAPCKIPTLSVYLYYSVLVGKEHHHGICAFACPHGIFPFGRFQQDKRVCGPGERAWDGQCCHYRPWCDVRLY